MDRHQMQFALLKIAVIVLAGVTWIFTGFLFESRPHNKAPVENALTSLVRLPASLPAELHENVFSSSARPMEPIRMDVVDLSCWDRDDNPVQNVKSRWIRLTGKPCHGDGGADQVTVRNLANGYQATIFVSQGASLTTDFIPLQKGANEIVIRFEQGVGVALESQYTFQRE